MSWIIVHQSGIIDKCMEEEKQPTITPFMIIQGNDFYHSHILSHICYHSHIRRWAHSSGWDITKIELDPSSGPKDLLNINLKLTSQHTRPIVEFIQSVILNYIFNNIGDQFTTELRFLRTKRKIHLSPIRPKNILVILSGRKPYQKVNMIVNKRTVMSMDQLISDISKALGRPKVWSSFWISSLISVFSGEMTVFKNFIQSEVMK